MNALSAAHDEFDQTEDDRSDPRNDFLAAWRIGFVAYSILGTICLPILPELAGWMIPVVGFAGITLTSLSIRSRDSETRFHRLLGRIAVEQARSRH